VPSRGRQRTPRAACLSSAPSPAADPTRHRPSRSDARVGTATICTFAAIRHGRSRAIARRRVAGRRPVVISSPERRASRIVLLQRLPRRPLRHMLRRALPSGAGRARRRVLHPSRVERRAPSLARRTESTGRQSPDGACQRRRGRCQTRSRARSAEPRAHDRTMAWGARRIRVPPSGVAARVEHPLTLRRRPSSTSRRSN
jgi:hypothetical protein